MVKWNIKNQILGSGLLSLVLLVGLVAYFYVFTSGEFRSNSEHLIKMATSRHADDVTRALNSQAATFDGWVKEDFFGLAIEFNTTGELATELTKWVAGDSKFSLLALVDQDGRVLEASFSEKLRAKSSSLSGQVLPEFRDLQAGGSRIVKYVQSPTLKNLGAANSGVFVFFQPAFNSSGERNGGFLALTDWSPLQEQVQACVDELALQGLSTAQVILAFPATGVVTADATLGAVETASLNQPELFAWSAQQSVTEISLLDNGGNPVFAGCGAAQPITTGPASAPAPVLHCIVPEDAVMAQLKGQLYVILVIGILCSLAVLGLNYYLAVRISRRVTRVADIAARMSEGDVDHEITIDSRDELGSLAESFKKLIAYQKELGGIAERISTNDLTVKVTPKSDRDLLGNAFKTMTGNFAAMIRQLGDNARQLTSAATEIASSSEEMSRGAGEQSQQTEKVRQAIEAVASSVLEAAQNAGQATQVAENASKTAAGGGEVVRETIQGMQRIAKVVRESADSIAKLSRSADEIGQIITVIDDIADQTNLLALNAAIEAARAGEQGRGFAVVADEVRKLAERTSKATGEIGQMIKSIQADTEEAVNSMEAGVQEVDKGRSLADQAGNSLREIVSLSENVSRMIMEIASAAQEQQAATEQITGNVEHIASVTKETASGAAQSATAAEQLNRQAETLQKIVNQFRV